MAAALTLADVSFTCPGRKRPIDGKDLANLVEFGDGDNGLGGLDDVVYSILGLVKLIEDKEDLNRTELTHVCVSLRTLAEAIAPHNVTPDDAQRCQVLVGAESDEAPTPPEESGNVRALRRPAPEGA